MSVDTFVSIVDTMLQAVAAGLMIMTASYGNKIDNVKQCFEYCLHSMVSLLMKNVNFKMTMCFSQQKKLYFL